VLKCAFALLLCTCVPALSPAQSFSCPRRTEDMMNYFVMAYPNRVDQHMAPGNANPIYSSIVPDYANSAYAGTGYFLWTKSPNGYPWDVKTFDSYYIYDRSTELNWNDPTSFKRFNQDLPMSQRCVRTDSGGTTLKIPASKTQYQLYSQCAPTQTQPLGNVVNSISAPSMANVGNVGSVKTRYFTYKYSCNQYYSQCQYMEVYSLGYGLGLYDWKYYVNRKGNFVLQQESVINNLQGGQTTPSLPCTSSYQ
jgi:hypothetical protein